MRGRRSVRPKPRNCGAMALRSYLQGLQSIHATGEAVEETSYYGQLEALLMRPVTA